MTEIQLYNSLEKYNKTVENKFKDGWGSMLYFLTSDDTPKLMDFSETILNQKKKELKQKEQEEIESKMIPLEDKPKVGHKYIID